LRSTFILHLRLKVGYINIRLHYIGLLLYAIMSTLWIVFSIHVGSGSLSWISGKTDHEKLCLKLQILFYIIVLHLNTAPIVAKTRLVRSAQCYGPQSPAWRSRGSR